MSKLIKQFSQFLVILMLLTTSTHPLFAQDTPLQGDLRVHDPVMIKQGNTYYVYHTGKGISIKTSKDRIHWVNAGSVFNETNTPAWWKSDIPNQDGNIWAPDIHYYKGKYYLYYSVSAWMNFNSSVGLAINTTLDPKDPKYKWVDQGQVISYKDGGAKVNVIDPNAFQDKDGKDWLVYGSYQAGLRLVQLDPMTGKLLQDPPQLTTITTKLGEGSFIIKGPKYYYIFASRGICCKGINSTYQVVIGRSKDVKGPYLNKLGESWVDNKYTLFLEGNYEEPGRGHNGFITDHDTTFIVYHAYTRSADGEPRLNIKPMYMDDQDWPTITPTKKIFKADIL